MEESLLLKAMELKGILHQEITYQEDVLENAGECFDGHSEDVHNSKTLLNAVDKFIAFRVRDRKEN